MSEPISPIPDPTPEPLPEGVWSDPPPPGPVPTSAEENSSARITILGTLYYQPSGGGEAQGFSMQYEFPLLSEEEPYRRKMRLDENWKKLDKGWLELGSALMVQGLGGGVEQEIQISFGRPEPLPCCRVPVDGGGIFHPCDLSEVYLRVMTGRIDCMVMVLPN